MSSETPNHQPEKKDKDVQADQEDEEANQADIKFSPGEEAASTHELEATTTKTPYICLDAKKKYSVTDRLGCT